MSISAFDLKIFQKKFSNGPMDRSGAVEVMAARQVIRFIRAKFSQPYGSLPFSLIEG